MAEIFARKLYSAKNFVSQTFFSERTQVSWLNKILLNSYFLGYWACSVSGIEILKFE